MALFVAKFLESTANRVRAASLDVDPDDSSLSECLKRGPPAHRATVAERRELLANLIDMYLARGPRRLAPKVEEVLAHCSADLGTSIAEIKALIARDQMELEARLKQEEETRISVEIKAQIFLKKSGQFLPKLNAISMDLSFIKNELLLPNARAIETAKYLEAVATATKLSNKLFKQPLDASEYLEGLIELSEAIKHIGGSRARTVMTERLSILKNTFIEKNLVKKNFEILANFTNSQDCFYIEKIVLESEMNKFAYHFERTESPLNLIDKPEWPLRRLLEIATEFYPKFPQRIALYLARKSREYFRSYRWALISDPVDSDLFSLNLAAYLATASTWRDTFSDDDLVMAEYMWEFTHLDDNRDDWSLMEAWIEHDKMHFERAIENTAGKFEACKLDLTIYNIAQTVSDLLIASNSRIASIRHDATACSAFTRYCVDEQLRDVIMHAFKVQARTGPKSELPRLRHSIKHILATMDAYDVGSNQIRKQLLELSTQLDYPKFVRMLK